MVSIGPTTSMRMEKFEKAFIAQTGVKLVVGKGGMGPETAEALQGAQGAALHLPRRLRGARRHQVERIERVEWEELGMPEALWVCRVKEFGPLIVSIDTKGRQPDRDQQGRVQRAQGADP